MQYIEVTEISQICILLNSNGNSIIKVLGWCKYISRKTSTGILLETSMEKCAHFDVWKMINNQNETHMLLI